MHNGLKLRRYLFACSLLALSVEQTHAQVNESALVQAMRDLGSHWQNLAQSGQVLIVGCPNNTFRAIRNSPGTSVSVDLRRTGSIMNPYVGIVKIVGTFQWNGGDSPSIGCHRTPLAAQQDHDWRSNPMIYEYEAYYNVEGSELVLSGGNEVFMNGFMRQYGQPYLEGGSAWRKCFAFHYRKFAPTADPDIGLNRKHRAVHAR